MSVEAELSSDERKRANQSRRRRQVRFLNSARVELVQPG